MLQMKIMGKELTVDIYGLQNKAFGRIFAHFLVREETRKDTGLLQTKRAVLVNEACRV